ncbi:NEQ550 [Nanoarchaeum equitans Kin4-M]|uniref:NEQ550 n=1 Tax=Nanoarchaeum equitans (strain Kin4-M) TaxID=228908 RepID=Q74M46_NANEQ|nr:NEQ550 [Nanoarchaeum equitans Kin4-M]
MLELLAGFKQSILYVLAQFKKPEYATSYTIKLVNPFYYISDSLNVITSTKEDKVNYKVSLSDIAFDFPFKFPIVAIVEGKANREFTFIIDRQNKKLSYDLKKGIIYIQDATIIPNGIKITVNGLAELKNIKINPNDPSITVQKVVGEQNTYIIKTSKDSVKITISADFVVKAEKWLFIQ